MLASYCNQQAEHQPLLGSNNRDEPIYGEPQFIACRKQLRLRQIVLPDQRQVQVEAQYYLTQSVAEGDLLDGRQVQLVQEWAALNGALIGWKVMA